MSHALVFQNTTFSVVDRNGQPWIRGYQLGTALGYTNQPDVAVRKVFTRHADEFTDDMTALVKLPTEGGEQEVRIFSPRGCYALAMFARTKVAKEFRRWVLDVLESIRKTGQYIAQPYSVNPGDSLTKVEADTLRGMLEGAAKKAYPDDGKKQGAFIKTGWSKLKAHFKVTYRDIPRVEFTEAVSLISRHAIEGDYIPSEPAADNISLMIKRWSDQIDQGKGYPVETFMPLVQAVLRTGNGTVNGENGLKVNIREWLLSGMSGPTMNFPHDIQLPLEQKAFAMGHEAVGIFREYLEYAVAYHSERGQPRTIDKAKALAVINRASIDSALAQTFIRSLDRVSLHADIALEAANVLRRDINRVMGAVMA